MPALSFAMSLGGGLGAQEASPPPDAGFFQEGLEQEFERREERELERRRPSDEPVIRGADPSGDGSLPETDDVFVLEAIDYNDSAFIDPQELQRIADDYVGIEIDFAALNRMVGRVNAIYAERGILTGRAMIPPQRVEDGILRVRLVEGRLGVLELKGSARIRDSHIEKRLPNIEPGDVVDVIALREAISWLNSTRDFQLGAALRAGAEPGETDVLVQVDQPPRFSAQLFTDNHGAASTGEWRIGTSLGFYSPFGIGDRLSFLLLGSNGSENMSLGYRFPVNRRGGQVELRYTEGSIEVIDGPFRDLNVEGDSQVISATFDQPLLRRDTRWLDLSLRASQTESDTTIEELALSEFTTGRAEAALRLTGFGERSQWTYRQGLEYAQLDDIQGASEAYWFLTSSGSYNVAVLQNVLLSARGALQYSTEDAVPSPLLFQVGGANSVRGYEESAVGGASGYFVNLESRYLGFNSVTPFAFIDHGFISDVSPSSETLISVGGGLAWQGPDWLRAEVTLGTPLRDVEADQDSFRLGATLSVTWSGG